MNADVTAYILKTGYIAKVIEDGYILLREPKNYITQAIYKDGTFITDGEKVTEIMVELIRSRQQAFANKINEKHT